MSIPLFELEPETPTFHMLTLVDLEKRPSVARCSCGEKATAEHPGAQHAIQAHVHTLSPLINGSDAARAVGRFNPTGPIGYKASTAPNAPLRATRAEAVTDERAHRESHSAQTGEPK